MRRRACASQRTARPSATRPNARRPDRTLFRRAAYADKLRAHRDTQLLERDFAGPAYTDRDLLFGDPLGAPIQPRRLGEHFHRHYEAAGIPPGTLHTPRHDGDTGADRRRAGAYPRRQARRPTRADSLDLRPPVA